MQKSCHTRRDGTPPNHLGAAAAAGVLVLIASVLGLRGGGVVLTLRVLKASQGALGLGARGEDGLHRCGALLVEGCV